MRKHLRILILLVILLFVAMNELANRYWSTNWDVPLRVDLYSVNGDARTPTERYIDGLTTGHFEPIQAFINNEARRYGISIDAVEVEYRGRLQSPPPQPPSGQSFLQNIWWSLRFRAWAMRHSWGSDSAAGDIELFISYYDTSTTKSLRHSVGLQGGLIGIINAFADKSYAGSNRVVIAHELMHTLGAVDKYDAANMPLYPVGYAEPDRRPLLPQRMAELMGGRIPLAAGQAKVPRSLREVLIGPHTAAEINWPVDAE